MPRRGHRRRFGRDGIPWPSSHERAELHPVRKERLKPPPGRTTSGRCGSGSDRTVPGASAQPGHAETRAHQNAAPRGRDAA